VLPSALTHEPAHEPDPASYFTESVTHKSTGRAAADAAAWARSVAPQGTTERYKSEEAALREARDPDERQQIEGEWRTKRQNDKMQKGYDSVSGLLTGVLAGGVGLVAPALDVLGIAGSGLTEDARALLRRPDDATRRKMSDEDRRANAEHIINLSDRLMEWKKAAAEGDEELIIPTMECKWKWAELGYVQSVWFYRGGGEWGGGTVATTSDELSKRSEERAVQLMLNMKGQSETREFASPGAAADWLMMKQFNATSWAELAQNVEQAKGFLKADAAVGELTERETEMAQKLLREQTEQRLGALPSVPGATALAETGSPVKTEEEEEETFDI